MCELSFCPRVARPADLRKGKEVRALRSRTRRNGLERLNRSPQAKGALAARPANYISRVEVAPNLPVCIAADVRGEPSGMVRLRLVVALARRGAGLVIVEQGHIGRRARVSCREEALQSEVVGGRLQTTARLWRSGHIRKRRWASVVTGVRVFCAPIGVVVVPCMGLTHA